MSVHLVGNDRSKLEARNRSKRRHSSSTAFKQTSVGQFQGSLVLSYPSKRLAFAGDEITLGKPDPPSPKPSRRTRSEIGHRRDIA